MLSYLTRLSRHCRAGIGRSTAHDTTFAVAVTLGILALGVSYYLPFPFGTLTAAALLIASAWALIRLNAPARLTPRRYHYA